tara:strand:- start:2936 stop:3553 length:618 start_codon:yes stop_codon:yes gene_type:complete
MAGAFPSSANFETLGLSSIQNTIISKSISGKKLSRQIDNQRFRFTIKIIVGKRSDIYGELMAFIMKQRSSKENFTISPPELKNIRGVESSTISVNGSHTAGDTTIALDGFGADTANRFRAGDMITFAGQTKVYMIVEDVTSSSNAATVTIEPPLRSALADDAVVTYNNINFTVHLTNDVQEFGVVGASKDGDLLYQFELDVEETL